MPLLAPAPVEATLALDDYTIIGEALHATETEEWPRALRLMAAVDDPLAAKLFRWVVLVEDQADADFDALARFIVANPTWPRLDELQEMAEERLGDQADQALTIQLFQHRAPSSTRGWVRYAEALVAAGRNAEAGRAIREAWIHGDFSASEEQGFLGRHRGSLAEADDDQRLDELLWDRRWRSAERMLPRVSADRQKLAEARLALQKQARGVDAAVNAVPASLASDPGLLYDRTRWRRQKQKHDGAVELLLDPPEQLVRPDRWWYERSYQIRRAIEARDFDTAYRLASRHGELRGRDYAEAEWLAGWLALRFVNRPKTAFRHFVRLYDRVQAPVRQSRAAYWAGRAAASQGDQAGATAWYRRAATHHVTYYGQLALAELGAEVLIRRPPAPARSERAAFEAKELAQVARMLIAAGADRQVDAFLTELAAHAATSAEIGMIADFANAAGRPALLAQLGRSAAFAGKVNEFVAFPIPSIEGLLQPAAGTVEAPLLLGMARQESMFRSGAASSAGARGLLQLLPSTARIVARQIGEDYDDDRLLGDVNYNARLGCHYMELMLARFDGELALALSAYNAGPLRVDQWIALHGDPRTGDLHDVADWIELIPFAETRNYVQRVMEGYQVYKRQLAAADVILIDYPGTNMLHPPPMPVLKPRDEAAAVVAARAGGDQAVHQPRLRPSDQPAEALEVSDAGPEVPSFDDEHSRRLAAEDGEAAVEAVPTEVPKL